MSENVKVEIVEQPATKKLRFRYLCEGRSAGSISGINSTVVNRTFPSIKVVNYSGPAIVVVSCVTVDKPYKPHPHSLVGKQCTKGVCKIKFQTDSSNPEIVTFPNVGIQCGKIKEIQKLLKERETLRIDPFKTGFKHKDNPKSIDQNVVRLCFQVLLGSENSLTPLKSVKPVVSDPIYDKKSVADLCIFDISDTTSPTCGGKKIMIFCEKVLKDDIKIRFFEGSENNSAWEDWAVFDSRNVHRQTAIAFRTPAYKLQNIDGPVNVFIQMERQSDKSRSEPLPFQYVGDVYNVPLLTTRKKRKIAEGRELFENLQSHNEYQHLRTGMDRNIDPNIAYTENIPAEGPQRRSVASNFDFSVSVQQQHQLSQYPPQPTQHVSYQPQVYEMQRNPVNGLSSHYNPCQYQFSTNRYCDPILDTNYNFTTQQPIPNWNINPFQMGESSNITGPSQCYPTQAQGVFQNQGHGNPNIQAFHQQINSSHHQPHVQQYSPYQTLNMEVGDVGNLSDLLSSSLLL